ncbi:MAG: tetratricopeptide repeat protein, partial [Myxococcales bacterium]|nr:tetratricopeptide repeat protein [Myxococcales bacterium]
VMKAAARWLFAVALLSTVRCRESPPSDTVQPAAAIPVAKLGATKQSATQPQIPRSQQQLPTTDGAIAASNFLGLYELSERTARAQPDKPPAQRIGLLLTHAQYFGALDDYDAALAAAERLVAQHPSVPEAFAARAAARQSLHLFAGALDDLTRAAQLGADRDGIDAARAGIFAALGRYDEALAIRTRLADKRATTATLGALAQLVGEMGQLERAEALFAKAQDAFDDVSPFPLAWLYFQNGLLEERAGRPAAARELYEAAHERLPIYAAATAHLAAALVATGDRMRAIALLEAVVASSDDPEYWGQLAELTRNDELTQKAKRRYEALLRRHADAFADHAARFYLGVGGDARRAATLATRNLAARKTREAYQLAIDAAVAARDDDAGCRLADKASAVAYPTAALRLSMSAAFARCHEPARAAAVLAAANR